jgi:hypothetical protein
MSELSEPLNFTFIGNDGELYVGKYDIQTKIFECLSLDGLVITYYKISKEDAIKRFKEERTMTPDEKEVRRMFQDLFKSALRPDMMDKLKSGKVIHMRIKLGGPYEIYWDEPPKTYVPDQI